MDARLTPLESSMDAHFTSLESTIATALSGHAMAMDTELAVGFEQFRHELAFTDWGTFSGETHALTAKSVVPPPILVEDADCQSFDTRHHQRENFDGGGFTLPPQWQQHVDFSHFSDDDDSLAGSIRRSNISLIILSLNIIVWSQLPFT